MKKRSLTDIKIARKWAVPAGIVIIGFAYIAVFQLGASGSKVSATDVSLKASRSQSSVSPAPKVSINGTEVPTDHIGSTSVNIPGGKAKVEVSGGSTRITTSESAKGNSVNTQSNNVNVRINSQSTSGNSRSSTQIDDFSRSSGNSSSSTHNITIFSTDSNNHTIITH